MYLGRVVGRVWATAKNASLEGQRMLVIQPLTPELRNTGKRLICLDTTGAGAGEIIYWVRGREASIALLPAEPPIDTTVVGIVDTIHLRTAPPGVEAAPGVQIEETGAQPAPSGVRAGETGAQAAPHGVEAAPLGAQGGETQAQTATERVGTGPTGVRAGKTGAQAATERAGTGPNGSQTAAGARSAPDGVQSALKDPAAAGSTRTATHRKGRRC
jgi:ethanolamine utilization protein EutN